MTKTRWPALLLLNLILAGCLFEKEEPKVAGGEDFPNTIQAAMASGLQESSSWQKMDSVQAPLLNLELKGADKISPSGAGSLAKVSAGPLAKGTSAPLAKASAGPEDVPMETDSVGADTAGGFVYQYFWKSSGAGFARDTIIFIYDDAFRDSMPGNDIIVEIHGSTFNLLGARLSYYRTQDGDGDSLLSASGEESRAVHTVNHVLQIFPTEERFVFTPGADGNIVTMDDNLIVEGENLTYYSSGDTAVHETFKDADGDGLVHPLASNQRNMAYYSKTEQFGFFRVITLITIEAGPDKDFGDEGSPAEADNRIMALKSVTLNFPDTTQIYEWEDADGDSIITAVKGSGNRARYCITTFPLFRIWERKVEVVVVGAGADNDFEGEADNRFISFESIIISLDKDTLEYNRASNTDGKSYLFIGGSPDPVNIDIFQLKKKPLLEPRVARVESRISMKVFPADSSKNYLRDYEEVKQWVNSARQETYIKGIGGGMIDLEDTVMVSSDFTSSVNDSLLSSSVSFKAGLGPDPLSAADDVLYSARVFLESRFGSESSIDFRFIPAKPLKHGEAPEYGRFELDLLLASGVIYNIEAEKTSKKTTLQYTSTSGERGSMEWNAADSLVRWDR